jgi:hypothetical protein
MKPIRNPKSIHAMNLYVREMSLDRRATVHDIDCIYRNHAKEFWCMFEWKWVREEDSGPGTLQSLHDMDVAFNTASHTYTGLFIVRMGWESEFPLDDTQKCEIQHICGGVVENHVTYTENARTAIQHILDHGKLLS